MRALILCGGFGSRLGKLTLKTPKPLLEIGTTTSMDSIIEKLFKNGIEEIIVNTHYLPELFEIHVQKKYKNSGINLIYEPKLLGSIGTVRTNFSWLAKEDFLVIHGDNFFEDDLKKIIDKQFNKNKIFVSTFQTKKPQDCGVFETNSSGRPIAFFEKKAQTYFTTANAGIFKFISDSIDLFSIKPGFVDISRDLLPVLLDQMELISLDGEFVDIGTPESLLYAIELQKKYES